MTRRCWLQSDQQYLFSSIGHHHRSITLRSFGSRCQANSPWYSALINWCIWTWTFSAKVLITQPQRTWKTNGRRWFVTHRQIGNLMIIIRMIYYASHVSRWAYAHVMSQAPSISFVRFISSPDVFCGCNRLLNCFIVLKRSERKLSIFLFFLIPDSDCTIRYLLHSGSRSSHRPTWHTQTNTNFKRSINGKEIAKEVWNDSKCVVSQ